MRIVSRLAAYLAALLAFAVMGMPGTAAAAEVRAVLLLTQPLSPFEEDVWVHMQNAQTDGIATEVKLIEMKNPSLVRLRGVSAYTIQIHTSDCTIFRDAMDASQPRIELLERDHAFTIPP